ncbi:hypothetical protein ACFPM3_06615 [Streptomyces coeruleoprunus]|uniref:Uncharacterized protein n=1 Tax=Streptomyces coeruleoprunus TaxID=285563 RepID=A0ABV9XCC5_9ACTN
MTAGLDLRIDRLTLDIDVPLDHRHRIEPITRRALALFEALAPAALVRLEAPRSSVRHESVSAGVLTIDLTRDSDETVAERIAHAWLESLRLTIGP